MKKALLFLSSLIVVTLIIIACSKNNHTPTPDPQPTTYSLTTAASPSNGGTISPASGTYNQGQTVTLTATSATNFVFKNWSGGASGTTNPVTITMNSNVSVTAVFEETPAVYANGEGVIGLLGGTISVTDVNSPIYGLKIIIPEGALSNYQTIQLKQAPSEIKFPEDDTQMIIEFLPSGLTFEKPIEIQFPVKEGGDATKIQAWNIILENDEIVQIPSSYDSQQNKMIFTTNHFSYFSISDHSARANTMEKYFADEKKLLVNFSVSSYAAGQYYVLGAIPAKMWSWPFGIYNAKQIVDIGNPITGSSVIGYFNLKIKEKNNFWVDQTIAEQKIIVKRIGVHEDGYGAEVYKENSMSYDLQYFAESMTDDFREDFFSGKALVFTFNDIELETNKEYYIKAQWGLVGDGNASLIGGRYTDLYTINSYDFAKKSSEMNDAGFSDLDGNYVDETYEVDQTPTADFSVSPPNGTVLTEFNFDATSSSVVGRSNYITRYYWDWDNDGNGIEIKTDPIATHQFNTEGTHTVKLIVEDRYDNSASIIKNIVVDNSSITPTANFNYSPQNGNFTNTYSFDASSSSSNALKFSWDFDNDGTWDISKSSSKTATKKFDSPGTYVIKLEVESEQGFTNTITKSIVVSEGGEFKVLTPNTNTQWEIGQSNVEVNWQTGDLEGNVIIQMYKANNKLGTLTPDGVPNNGSYLEYDVPTLAEGNDYRIKIIFNEDQTIYDFSDYFEIKEPENLAPGAPYDPYPDHESTLTELKADLFWNCSDPEEDPLTYDVYADKEDDNPTTLIAENINAITFSYNELEQGKKYYWKVIAKDDHGNETTSAIWWFETPLLKSIPLVTTTDISEKTETTAVGGGNVTSDGNSTVTARGVCWSTSENPNIDDNSKTTDGIGTGEFTSNLTDLTPNTLYYVRAYAINSEGPAYGLQKQFTTDITIALPSVTTTDISDVTETTAVSGGNVTNDGNATVTARGVCWSTSENPNIDNNSKTTDGTGTGEFTSNLTDLTPNTLYYVRAYAINSEGPAYGIQKQFTTENIEISDTFIDPRDEKSYKYVKIGNQTWMAENLAYEIPNKRLYSESDWATKEDGWSYDVEDENTKTCGIYYQSEAAKIACPDGWHLPTEGEWNSMVEYLGGREIAGGKMKDIASSLWYGTNVGATNESGFTGLPGGIIYSGQKIDFGFRGWWRFSNPSINLGWHGIVGNKSGNVNKSGENTYTQVRSPKSGINVRCIKGDVLGVKPIADFSANKITGTAPTTIYLTDQSSNQPTEVEWRIETKGEYAGWGLPITADGNTFITLTEPGTYDVALIATNYYGSDINIKEDYITITEGGFEDERDGKIYKTVEIGSQTWFAENLNHETTNSWWYNNNASLGEQYGRLYEWNDAISACPEGWILPAYEDWNTLINYLGGEENAGAKLNKRSYYGTNESGFTGLHGGVYNILNNTFSSLNLGGSFWTSSDFPNDITTAKRIVLMNDNEVDLLGGMGKTKWANSVRCLKGTGESPISDFYATNRTGKAPLIVNFYDNSTKNPSTWLWTFGDGSTSTSKNTYHTYTNPGTYTVSLTVTNIYGLNKKTLTNYVTVTDGGSGGDSNTMTDTRDGQVYKTVKIGDQTWFAENLNYQTSNSWWQNNNIDFGDVWGRLYLMDAAKNACPDGWHLPSDNEWKKLEIHLGMSQSEADNTGNRGTDQGSKLKSTEGGWLIEGDGTNESGFTALPGGRRMSNGVFNDLFHTGLWWTSSDVTSTKGWARALSYQHSKVDRSSSNMTQAFSVRCVKD